MATIFKKGDKVFDIRYGWGEITCIDNEPDYPVYVMFKDSTVVYTKDGKFSEYDLSATLSLTEYTLQGFSQERPKKQPEIGSLCLFSDDESSLKSNHGVVGTLREIKNDSYIDLLYTEWSHCKQIKIEEV